MREMYAHTYTGAIRFTGLSDVVWDLDYVFFFTVECPASSIFIQPRHMLGIFDRSDQYKTNSDRKSQTKIPIF